MINETRIVNMLFSTALAAIFCLCSCTEKQPTTAPEPENLPVGFRPMSQAVWVKSGTSNASGNGSTTAEPMFPYDNFGVWGIARQGSLVYNLWGNDGLAEVVDPEHRIANKITNSTTPRVFTPTTDAYWLRGYTYNFLAIAPLNPTDFVLTEIKTKEDQKALTPSITNPVDYMTFTYDMSSNYMEKNYTFDLLGAAAEQEVNRGGYSESQSLIFWHLLSKLSIRVIFVDGADAEETSNNGAVTKLSIRNVNPKGSFTIKYITPAGSMANLSVVTEADTQAQNKTLEFDVNSVKDDEGRWNAHIIPQTISNFVIDIAYNVTGSDGNITYYNDSISLRNSTPASYDSNGQYNWTIRINPKGTIGFNVEIDDWNSTNVGNDIEIL